MVSAEDRVEHQNLMGTKLRFGVQLVSPVKNVVFDERNHVRKVFENQNLIHLSKFKVERLTSVKSYWLHFANSSLNKSFL